jgi:Fic-DOC domain mobile mystery protein B
VEQALAAISPLAGAHAPGATPLEPGDLEGLIPGHIRTQGELNEWEQTNVLQAMTWLRSRLGKAVILDEAFVRELHRKMFGETWKWAGTFRKRETNLGVDPSAIATKLHDLLADCTHWIEHDTYPIDEIVTRFHHRLVSIHPFPNGNGRHSRLMADALLQARGASAFSWGGGENLEAQGAARETYLAALRRADQGEYDALLAFVRT